LSDGGKGKIHRDKAQPACADGDECVDLFEPLPPLAALPEVIGAIY